MVNEENELVIAPIIGQLYLRGVTLPDKEYYLLRSIMEELGCKITYFDRSKTIIEVATPHHKVLYDVVELTNRNLLAAAK